MTQYLIRLDDACPTMDAKKWKKIEDLLDVYGVRPMVGVIPSNKDQNQMLDATDREFWTKVKKWEKKGWAIALHGYDHCFISDVGMAGLNPMWDRSEFAGVSLECQMEKVKRGVSIFRINGFDPKYFFAPAHTYDDNTLVALSAHSNIRIISDTVAFKPYKEKGFIFVPQFGGSCRKMIIPGVYTFCFHPNNMTEKSFDHLETFLSAHKNSFISFDDLDFKNLKHKSIWDFLLSKVYFLRRRF